jgi:hypothetical protein
MTHSVVSELPVGYRTAQPAKGAATYRGRARVESGLAQDRPRRSASTVPLIFSIAVAAVLAIGWLNRDDNGLTPESGVGYWLGIVGSSLMLLLLLYPLRKRLRFLRPLGTVALWFRTHMVFGVVGPVLILLHANFKFGSINSNMALAAMLVVAISGVVGRYLYGKIHMGLYGRKAEVQELLADADTLKDIIGADLAVADRVVSQLNAFAQLGIAAPKGVLAGFFLLPAVSWHAMLLRVRLLRDARQVIADEGRRLKWSRRKRRQRLAVIADHVTLYVVIVKKAAALAFYERLFGLWHIFHLPLFFVLVIAAIVHIFAAHFF